MSQQEMYEEAHRYNRYGDRDKLSVPPLGVSLTAAQRLILALASLVMIMIMTFGLVLIAATMHAPDWAVFPILFVLVMFTSGAVIINIVFNRRA